MYNTTHENGVLICCIHETPISKSHGRFFCLKCQRDAKPEVQQITELVDKIQDAKDLGKLDAIIADDCISSLNRLIMYTSFPD